MFGLVSLFDEFTADFAFFETFAALYKQILREYQAFSARMSRRNSPYSLRIASSVRAEWTPSVSEEPF